MQRILSLLLFGLVALSMSACNQTLYSVLDFNAAGNEIPDSLVGSICSDIEDAGAYLSEADGKTYIIVSTGEEHKLDQHLRLLKAETDSSTKAMTFTFERFQPNMNSFSSTRWFPIIRFKRIMAPSVKIIINDEQGTQVAEYIVEIPK